MLHRKKSNKWPIVSFIHNGSEITKDGGIASKPKAKNPKQHFQDKKLLFWISSCRSLDYHKDTGGVCHLFKTAIFIVTSMKKTFSSLFYQRVFYQFVDRKVMGWCQSIDCLLNMPARFLFFSQHEVKMSKQHRFIL